MTPFQRALDNPVDPRTVRYDSRMDSKQESLTSSQADEVNAALAAGDDARSLPGWIVRAQARAIAYTMRNSGRMA